MGDERFFDESEKSNFDWILNFILTGDKIKNMIKVLTIAAVFLLFSLTSFKADYQSKPPKAVDFLAQPEKLRISLHSVSAMGHKLFYRDLPQAYYEEKSIGLYHVIFKPKDYAKWDRMREEAVGKKTYKVKKEWATKRVKEIISDEAARLKFDIYAFHVKPEEVTKENDLHSLVTTPKFPCNVYIYKLKNKKWVLLRKEIAKDFVGFSNLRYFVVVST